MTERQVERWDYGRPTEAEGYWDFSGKPYVDPREPPRRSARVKLRMKAWRGGASEKVLRP